MIHPPLRLPTWANASLEEAAIFRALADSDLFHRRDDSFYKSIDAIAAAYFADARIIIDEAPKSVADVVAALLQVPVHRVHRHVAAWEAMAPRVWDIICNHRKENGPGHE